MRRPFLRSAMLISFLLLDACALVLAFELAFTTRFHLQAFLLYFPLTKGYPGSYIYHQALYALLPMWLLVFYYVGIYKETFVTAYDELIKVIKAVILCSLLTTTMSFGYRGAEYSRLVIALWCVYSLVLIYGIRELAKALLRRLETWVSGPQQVLVIGHGKMIQAIKRIIDQQPFAKAVFLEALPSHDHLEAAIRKHRISEVLLNQGDLSSKTLLDAATVCEHLNIPCKIVPDILELRRGEIIVDGFLGLPTFRIKPLSLHGADYLMKRAFDLTLSVVLLLFLFVPCLLIALLIRLDTPGPIFHTQDRMGFRLQPFKFYKFRTMVVNADALLNELKAFSDRSGPVFKMKSDPRITRIGRWLRMYSLDELPQVFNVLRGDMSFVGPRPQVLWEAAHYDDTAKKRLRVKPGITGLWQVSGRATLSYEDMINLDIYYLENWSLGLDLKIIMRTLPAIFAGQGAY